MCMCMCERKSTFERLQSRSGLGRAARDIIKARGFYLRKIN